jgi:Mrp family chromosome partitioning ATPase
MNRERRGAAPPLAALRARLAAALPEPGILAVTSARPGDGKSVTAADVARKFALAGNRTILVDANEFHHELGSDYRMPRMAILKHNDPPQVPDPNCERLYGVSLWDEPEAGSVSREAVSGLCALLRARFRYTIVDCAPLPVSSLAAHFAGVADSVIVAVREGRSRHGDDALLTELLQAGNVSIAGVVSTSRAARSRFARRSQTEPGERRWTPATIVTFAGASS